MVVDPDQVKDIVSPQVSSCEKSSKMLLLFQPFNQLFLSIELVQVQMQWDAKLLHLAQAIIVLAHHKQMFKNSPVLVCSVHV